MQWRVVKSTDRGYVAASKLFNFHKEALAECRQLQGDSDDYFAVQEMPSGAVVLDAWPPMRQSTD